jgi:hypothetical protein
MFCQAPPVRSAVGHDRSATTAPPADRVTPVSPGAAATVAVPGPRDALAGTLRRAVADRGAVLMRYREVTDANSSGTQPARLVTQGRLPQIAERQLQGAEAEGPDARLPYDFAFPQKVRSATQSKLLVADDDSMAIHNTKNEPKEFFADPRVVERANAQLTSVDSAYGLEISTDEEVTVASKRLFRVRPVNVTIDDPTLRYVDMAVDACIEICGTLMGNQGDWKGEVVLGGGGSRQHAFTINPGGQTDTRMQKLMHDVATRPTTPDAIPGTIDAAPSASALTSSAESYGKDVRSGAMDATARALRINQYVIPRVGEGIATYNNPGADPTIDFATPSPSNPRESAVRPKTWGYHYAGVAAKSLSGDDFVTLENYNRRPDLNALFTHLHELLYKQLWASQASMLDTVRWYTTWGAVKSELTALSTSAGDDEYAVQAKIVKIIDRMKLDGSFETSRVTRAAKAQEAWFFRMYSTAKPGQTFHERTVAGGDFVNALSVRVRKISDFWAGRLRDDRELVEDVFTVAPFDAGSQAVLAPLVDTAREDLLFMIDNELSIADQSVKARWDATLIERAKGDLVRRRRSTIGSANVQACRQAVHQLLSSGSATDKSAAVKLLDAHATLLLPRWWL